MILAVAGMSAEEVAEKSRRLATGVGVTPAEAAAAKFIRKQAKTPWAVTDADVAELEAALGKTRAWHAIWWASRSHYMTKVADAFQLPLEQDNPFRAMPGAKPEKKGP